MATLDWILHEKDALRTRAVAPIPALDEVSYRPLVELLLDVCCIVVSLCLSSDGSRCGSFSFVAFVAAIWPMLFCKLLREPSLCFGPCIARM